MFGTAPKSRLERLADKLGRLKTRDPNQRIFGADEHRWATRPPLTTTEIESFERRHGVALPAEYREFVQSIARGEDAQQVLDTLARGLTQKMLHGAYAELGAADATQRDQVADAVTRLFLRRTPRTPDGGNTQL